MPIASVNPYTGETAKMFATISDDEIDRAITAAHEALVPMKYLGFSARGGLLYRAAEILDRRSNELASLMTIEMGKPIRSAREEIVKCAWVCRYYAENGERFLADEPVPTNASNSSIRYQPLGVILAVMPWNFPFWQVFRFAAPALMAGNTALLKHASNVPQCALAIQDIFRLAGFPGGAFRTLLADASQVSRIIDDPRVRAVTLTGSEPAGSSVASAAGKMLKKTVMELGGSDPFVVLPGADLETAATTAVRARIVNNGQSCIAAKRFILHETIADEFTQRFIAGMQSLVIGDPMREETDLGPMASEALLRQLDAQVRQAVSDGATILLGGGRLPGKGSFYAPTVLTGISHRAAAYREEFFGPVALLFRVKSLEEALAVANDTPFGLGSSVWTNNLDEQQRCIDELEAGLVFVNGMVASDPRLPFGGVKRSGYGRELGVAGIREFVNIKTVWVA
jgi:succinate-semialdehyde dehydrogenase/glutarate-semialdehyde dehydrogenase